MAQAFGVETPTWQDLARLHTERPNKGFNEDRVHPGEPEPRDAKMKDARTRLARKLERAALRSWTSGRSWR